MAPGPDHIISLGTVPRSICVHRFFHEADARRWHQVETFFKYRDTNKTAQEHQELYQRDLQTISEHTDVPAALQRRAHYLLQKVDAKFHETFSQLLVKARQRQAEESVRGLFFDVAQCAGRGGSSSSLGEGAISSSREHIKILNQEHEWISLNVDLVALFKGFAAKQTSSFSLARDGIADLSSQGEFAAALTDNIFDDVMDSCPSLKDDARISGILEELFPFADTTFETANAIASETRKNGRLTTFVTRTMANYSLFYPHYMSIPPMNERQHFVEVAMPAFRHAFRLVGKDIQLFEVKILGCGRRKNEKRIPLVDKLNYAHMADGIVAHNGLQIVLFECSPPVEKNLDKAYMDHFKMTRDLKDTWVYNVEQLIRSGRQPPRGLRVFGVTVDTRFLKVFALNLAGCFCLQEIASLELPVQQATFATNFTRLVKVAYNFAEMVRAEAEGWGRALTIEQAQIRKARHAIQHLPPTNVTPTKMKRMKRSHGHDEDDEEIHI
ncbi:hypothetical protein BG011_010171 [Mortierella polycephala]|uniref:Uncharacterized protein n=1 Tax=Mortierella polycephala TaxID=41804 RepID=A0A9P6PN57_9FUNG|nr:hypothetical protein BG011_010171 [Mortierella polycephala]